MTRKRAFFLAGILAVSAALVALAATRGGRREGPAEPASPDSAPPLVRVTRVTEKTIERRVTVPGTIRAARTFDIVAESSGILERFSLEDGRPVEEGVRVGAGELVAVVSPRHLEARVREAESRLAAAEAALGEARVVLDDAGRELARMDRLFARGVVAGRDRERAETARDAAAARLSLLEEQVAVAGATLESERLRYRDHRVYSPWGGIVSRRMVEPGAWVTPSLPLARVSATDRVELVGSLAERHLDSVRAGETPVLVRVDALPDLEVETVVTRVSPEIDPQARTFGVVILIDNPGGRLRPGMFARLSLIPERRRRVPAIPDAALVGDGQEVLVIENDRARLRRVSLGLKSGDLNEVLAGVGTGDLVVIRGHDLVEDGMTVRVFVEGGDE